MSRKVVGTCINICGEDQCVFCILKEMGGSQKLLLTTKESIVFNSILSGPPCTVGIFYIIVACDELLCYLSKSCFGSFIRLRLQTDKSQLYDVK